MTYLYVFIFCPFGRALSDTLPALQRPGVCVVSCAVCPAVCGSPQSVRVRWGLGSPPAGYMGRAGGVGGQSLDFRSPRKRRFRRSSRHHPPHLTFTNQNPPDCASLQKFRKIQKGPSPGLICAILDRKKGAL